MVFASTQFLFWFMPLFFLCYYGIGHFGGLKVKNYILFFFSMIFYSWGEPLYVLLMIYSTVLDYTCGRMIEHGRNTGKKWLMRLFLGVSLVGNLLPLSLFKYADMFLLSANHLFDLSIPALGLTMPIGISFYTFQTMSYSIDIYRGKFKPQKNIIYFGAYVVMFPQLIAGPVLRYSYVVETMNDRKETLSDFTAGMKRFILGLAKKIIIANTMASVCDKLFILGGNRLGALGSWIAIIAYTFQIYYDFSGYSDMAVGMGRMMGFEFPENFIYPYISRSVTEFWRRWHITMSTFFRDYVYFPLGGSRVKTPRWLLNIVIVWALTGLWHGASWNFVLWGLYFAAILILEKLLLHKVLDKTHVVSRIWTMFVVIIGWVLFNATEDHASGLQGMAWLGDYLKAMFGGFGLQGTVLTPAVTELVYAGVNVVFVIALAAAVVFSTPIVPFVKRKVGEMADGGMKTALCVLGDVACLALLTVCISELAIGSYNPFIYFRF